MGNVFSKQEFGIRKFEQNFPGEITMKKMIGVLLVVAAAVLAALLAWAAAPGDGEGMGGMGRGAGMGGGMSGRGGGRGNSGDTARSNNPSAKSLSLPATPTIQPDASGYIKRWSILEPIYGVSGSNQNAFHANAQREYFPGQMTVIPKNGDKVTVNGSELTWHAVDTKNYNVNLVHFANDLGISSDNGALFWVVAVVNFLEETKDVRLAIGSNDASVWWINGQEVTGIYGDILSFPDDAVSRRITMNKGPNVIRGAIHNQRGQTDFCARILDEAGNPIKTFTVSLSLNGN
jgi:hypothetical protein